MSRPPATLRIAAPLRIEARALRQALPSVPVLRCGAGPRRAAAFAASLQGDAPQRLVVAGVCGGLGAGQEPGDLVVASAVSAGGATIACSGAERLRDALIDLGFTVHVGTVRGVDHLVSGAERARLARAGAIAVDMESYWLAAALPGTELTVLRAVSDAPGAELRGPRALRHGWLALRALRRAAPALLEVR